MNAFAFRATDPRDMKAHPEPIGDCNDDAIRRIAGEASLIVAAWGVHCPAARESRIADLIGCSVYCLGKTKKGKPKHPLYLASDTRLKVLWEPSSLRPALWRGLRE